MTFPQNLRFSTLEEVGAFERMVQECHLALTGAPAFEWASLEDGWVVFHQFKNGGRPFSALLDLRLAVFALQCELMEIRNEVSAESRREAAGEPPDPQARLKLFRINSSYILRTRAILDKVMGFVVMTAHPEEYDSFRRKKRSRKKAFEKLSASRTQAIGPLSTYLGGFIDLFDRSYRTAEAHDTGSVRTWVFGKIGGFDGPQADMFSAWNSLHPLLSLIGSALKEARANLA